MIRDAVVVWAATVCAACCAAEWDIQSALSRHGNQIELSEAQQTRLQAIDDTHALAYKALAQSRKATGEVIAQVKGAHADAIRDVLTPNQQDRLAELSRASREREAEDQLAIDVDYLNQLLPILEKLKAIDAVAVLEGPKRVGGQPHLEAKPVGVTIIQVDNHDFFEKPLELEEEDVLSIKEVVCNYHSFDAQVGFKACGGFHPDANIRLVTNSGEIQMLVCFGCSEVRIIDGEKRFTVDLQSEAYSRLYETCSHNFRHR